MGEESIKTLIEHVLDNISVDRHVFVGCPDEADLIISDCSCSIKSVYSPEKVYGLIDMYETRSPDLQVNIEIIYCVKLVDDLVDLVHRVWADLDSDNELPTYQDFVDEKAVIKSDCSSDGIPKILVVSGNSDNQKSACRDFEHYHLTVAVGYDCAMSILNEERFDVVLTDLGIPMDLEPGQQITTSIGRFIPYGILVMIEAAHRGIKHVAVVTDDNDHDEMAAAVDHFIDPINIDGAKVQMIHTSIKDDGSKDWKKALWILMAQK